MRWLIIILLVLLGLTLCGCGTPDAPSVVPSVTLKRPDFNNLTSLSFIVAGQSNAVSPAQYTQLPMGATSGRVTINDVYDPISDLIMRISTPYLPQSSGITWMYLGDMWNKFSLFNNIARGGRTTQQWVDNDYKRLVNAMQDGRHYDAVLWVQGEGDTGVGLSEEQSYRNMLYLISLTPGVPWFIALDGDCYASYLLCPNVPPVRKAQERIIAEGRAFRGPDIDAMREVPGYFEAGKGEFGSIEGYKAHASAWFEVLK